MKNPLFGMLLRSVGASFRRMGSTNGLKKGTPFDCAQGRPSTAPSTTLRTGLRAGFPRRVRKKDEGLFSFAGLWEQWTSPKIEPLAVGSENPS